MLLASAGMIGYQYGFFGGDILKLIPRDIPLLKPTIFCSVPRLFNRIFDKLSSGFKEAGGCKGYLASMALTNKLKRLE